MAFVFAGYFFALCVSDLYDIGVNFSLERFALNLLANVAFLLLGLYVFFFNRKQSSACFKAVVWTSIVFIGTQCFVFPYRTETGLMRVLEAIEGAAVFGLFIALVLNLKNSAFGKRAALAVFLLEFAVAIANVICPIASVTGDFQLVDIALNFQSLFIRPIMFCAIALSYRAWLDRHVGE